MQLARFTQIIDFYTDDIDEMMRLDEEYLEKVDRSSLFERGQTIRDHDDPTHFFVVLEYASEEQMQETQASPESKWLSGAVEPLIKGTSTVYNCDVVSQSNLDTAG